MTLGGSGHHLISLIRRLKLKRISQTLRLTQGVRELEFILFHSWFSVHAAILDGSQRCRERPPLDCSSLWLFLFRWKRRWNNLGWVSCLLSWAHKLCGYWSPATIPQVCINLLKGWSPYLLSEHLLDSDLVSLPLSTVFGIQQAMGEMAWAYWPGEMPVTGRAIINLACSPIEEVSPLEGRLFSLAPGRNPAFSPFSSY